MKQKSEIDEGLTVGDRVKLVAESRLAEMTLRGKVGEVTDRRDDAASPSASTTADFLWAETPNLSNA
jgi:hypothetical protein